MYEHMKTVLTRKGSCVIVIAEGAGQDLVAGEGGTDASGNPILADIGQWFVKQVCARRRQRSYECSALAASDRVSEVRSPNLG